MIFATETIALGSLVLVDTSVWIDYFRKKDPAYSKVDNLMEEEEVGICRLIIAELLQGAKGSKEIEIILDLPCVFPVIDELSDTWEKTGLLANQLRGQGITIGLADCYLATLAHQNNVRIFSHDSHFRMIKSFTQINLLE